MKDPIREASEAFMKKANDDGKLLEAGFWALQVQVLKGWSPEAIETARLIYMAGAQHLWASMFALMSMETEPTKQDMLRMSLISVELQKIEPHLHAMVVAGQRKGPLQ